MNSLYLECPASVSSVLLTHTVKIAHQQTGEVFYPLTNCSKTAGRPVLPDRSLRAIPSASEMSNFEHWRELKRAREEVNRNLRTVQLQFAHYRAKVHVPELHVPSKLALAFRDLNFGLAKRISYSRADIRKFWAGTWRKWRRKKIFHIPPHKVIVHFLRDVQLILLFAGALLRAPMESQ